MAKIKGQIEVKMTDPQSGEYTVVFTIDVGHAPDSMIEIGPVVAREINKAIGIVRGQDIKDIAAKDKIIQELQSKLGEANQVKPSVKPPSKFPVKPNKKGKR